MFYSDVVKAYSEKKTSASIDRFFLKFTYSSIRLEDNEILFTDVENIFSGERTIALKSNNNTIKEIENHRKLCQRIIQLGKENEGNLSINLIKEFHYSLMNDCITEKLRLNGEKAGEFRKHKYSLNLYEISEIQLLFEDYLASLISEINNLEITEHNALKVMSYLLCCFENIRPFAYGNGRVGRMLINYVLINNTLPPIIIFPDDKEEYYSALGYFNLNHETCKMEKFLDDQAYKTWIKDYNIKLKSLKYFLD